jgi:hypothetical protein
VWQPDPGWTPLRPGGGASSVGLWRADHRGRPAVVKRLRRPHTDDPAVLSEPRHAGYWRREVEVACDPRVVDGPGLAPPAYLRIDEDDEGATVWAEELVGGPPPALQVARALGRFAAAPYDEVPWAARDTLTDRLAITRERGGWRTLARTPLADVTDHLWQHRGHWLEEYAAAPVGRLHGDAVPANFPAAQGDLVMAVDWQGFGTGPLGADLGYYALSTREDFEVLLEAFLGGLGEQQLDVDQEHVRVSATVMCVYSAINRAEWALSRAAPGEGALHGKFNHPSVAPYLRALQRHFPQIEALVDRG